MSERTAGAVSLATAVVPVSPLRWREGPCSCDIASAHASIDAQHWSYLIAGRRLRLCMMVRRVHGSRYRAGWTATVLLPTVTTCIGSSRGVRSEPRPQSARQCFHLKRFACRRCSTARCRRDRTRSNLRFVWAVLPSACVSPICQQHLNQRQCSNLRRGSGASLFEHDLQTFSSFAAGEMHQRSANHRHHF